MDDTLNQVLRQLVRGRAVAALGTVEKGEPFVSMVPYIMHGAGVDFLIHVSGLSAHTRQMLAHPQVSVMVTAAENAVADDGSAIEPQALPRVTVQGDAARIDPADQAYAAGKAAYLERFPLAGQMFELPDFSLFAIRPRLARFIAGFGKAHSLNREAWARALGRP
jgi:putative heme iron utilization protein